MKIIGPITKTLLSLVLIFIVLACNQNGDNIMKIKKEAFGKLSDGQEVDILTLTHPDGSEVRITNFGAAVVSVKVPDNNGNIEDVVLGFDDLENYEKIRAFYGAIVGRYGNRIDKGKFTLDYVLIPKEYKFKTFKCEGTNLSDHRALITEISVYKLNG